MANAQKEEFKHFGMNLEFLLRKTDWRSELLFTKGDIVKQARRPERKSTRHVPAGGPHERQAQTAADTRLECRSDLVRWGGDIMHGRNLTRSGVMLAVASPLLSRNLLLRLPRSPSARRSVADSNPF